MFSSPILYTFINKKNPTKFIILISTKSTLVVKFTFLVTEVQALGRSKYGHILKKK